ncbi:MAG: NADH-quinone oxidoreductase subunit NuoG [Anaerolineae bacterium]|nr:NADH-quinone oxidoreductase subunit NuoG [Anaerolineae bacterium]
MTDKIITIHIDGVPYDVPEGMNLVDAARVYAGVEIPIFCYHPKMDAVGMCRMCLVEVGFEVRDRATGEPVLNPDGTPQVRWGRKLETGCTTLTRAGLHIRTTTPQVQEARKDVLEFLLSSHPLDCPICDKGGECPLQNLTMRHGPGTSRMVFEEKMHLAKNVPLGDLIVLDRERCIQCARCVRFQAEVVGDDVLAFYERGRRLEIITVSNPPFDTYFSGNTTDICPVGALTSVDFRFGARPWELQDVPSISPHGPVGENIVASTRLDRDSGGVKVIKRILPRQNEAVNEIWISDKTRFGHHFSMSPDRLRTPLIRKRGELVEAGWDDAIRAAGKALKEAGSSVGFIGGPMMTNEDLFALRELAELVGSRRLGVWPPNLGDPRPVAEVGLASGSRLVELGKGDAVLVIASDLEEEAPIWYLQAKQAHDRGAAVIVANMRVTKLEHYADEVIRFGFGGAVDILNGLTAAALTGDLTDSASLERAEGLAGLRKALKGRAAHQQAAATLARATNLVIFAGDDGLDAAGHSALLQAAANFLIVTGHAGRRNNGLVPVWPGANTQGAFDLGFSAAETRAMLQDPPAVLVIAGADVAYDPAWAGVLSSSTVIALSLFPDATTTQAAVVLPIQSFAEREGTFTNALRRVQRFYTLHGPVGQSLPAWEVAALIGQRLGGPKPRHSAALVMKAITESVSQYAEMSYPALAQVEKQFPPIGEAPGFYGGTAKAPTGGTGRQWPCLAEGSDRLPLRPAEASAPARAGDGELVIVPVRRLYDRAPEFYASTLMHGRIPQPFAALNSADAARLGIAAGDPITITVAGSSLTVTAVVNDYAPAGVVLVPQRLSDDPLPFVPTVGVVARSAIAETV